MSCWHLTVALRIPASALGFKYLREWKEFLQKHEDDFCWEEGCFCEALCDSIPWELDRSILVPSDPDCRMKSGRPSLSAYVRKHIIWSGSDPYDLRREVRSMTFQVRKAGVNINQAVRRINADLSTGNEIREILASTSRTFVMMVIVSAPIAWAASITP